MFLYYRKCKLGDLVEVAIAAGNFKTLVQIIVDLDLVEQFKGKTPQTVFAPSDEAFAKLPEGTLANLTDRQKAYILFRHVLYNVTVLGADIEIGPLKTLNGEVIDIIIEDNTGEDVIQIEYKGSLSSVVTADVMASNGVIHVIDNVILPAEPPLGDVVDVAIAAGNFKTLVQILTDLRLVPRLKSYKAQTIFAPSDEAFAKLPEGTLANLTNQQKFEIVARHVVSNVTVLEADVEIGPLTTLGGEVIDIFTDNSGEDVIQIEYKGSLSTVVTADVMASNGVIHVIDNVILPAEPPLGNVVDVAIAAGNFKTLVQIIVDLNLVDVLVRQKAQTIFAPSDEAFAKLPKGLLETLTKEQKIEIVARHVVPNITVPKADVETGPLKTLGGEIIDILVLSSTVEDIIQIEYKGSLSSVVTADVMASNGVIHVIDNVILPAEPPLGNVVDVAIAAGNFKTLVQIIVDLNLVDVLVRQKAQTIFAPSDEAFAKLPKGLLETLTKEQKIEIVARHVVPNITVPKADVETGPLKTLGGEVIDIIVITNAVNTIQIEYKGSSSSVVTADVMASNGVIHVIDNVILPPTPTTTTKITTTAPPPTPILPGLNLCFPQEFDFNARSAEPISQLNIVICGENEVCQPIGDGELGKYG